MTRPRIDVQFGGDVRVVQAKCVVGVLVTEAVDRADGNERRGQAAEIRRARGGGGVRNIVAPVQLPEI